MAVPTAQELLDKIDTALATRLDGGAVASFSILGRNIALVTFDELRRLRADVAQRMLNEEGVDVLLADLEYR